MHRHDMAWHGMAHTHTQKRETHLNTHAIDPLPPSRERAYADGCSLLGISKTA